MNNKELENERKENIEYLNSILREWRSSERKMKKALVFIIVICAIAVYFMFSYLFGYKWGYVVTIIILGAGLYFANKLGVAYKNDSWSEGKIAYQACVTMEILIAIKNGTYRKYGAHVLITGTGKHYGLYKQFIKLYPEYKCKDLRRLAKIDVELNDIYN